MKRLTQRDKKEIASVLKKGGILALPTETVYGLAVDLNNKSAINKLLELKQRPVTSGKVLTLMLPDVNMLDQYAAPTRQMKNFARHFFPGELTMIMPKNAKFTHHYFDNFNNIGIRIPNYGPLLDLLRSYGPLLVTSANPRGEESCRNYKEVLRRLPQIDAVVEGKAGNSLPSTIIDFTQEEPRVVRQGGLLVVHY